MPSQYRSLYCLRELAHQEREPKGKLIGQFTVSILFTLVVVNVCHVAPTVQIPFLPVIDLGVLTTTLPIAGGIDIPWLYAVFCAILLAGMSNAVNLTDGLDGLAAGTVMVSMLVMGAIAYASDILPLAVFGATIAGACVGFLWFNTHLLLYRLHFKSRLRV